MKTFSITTLGCRVNQSESALIADMLKGAGLQESKDAADLCIINTCTVTQKASMQSRQAVRKAIRENPGARIIVTGCYADIDADKIREIRGVDDVIENRGKLDIPALLGLVVTPSLHEAVLGAGGRTRPILKIQDGCNTFCTYCIVPYARGRSRSMPPEKVIEAIHRFKKAGFHETVLAGIHLGAYGLDLAPEIRLSDLLQRLKDLDCIDRIRLSSIEPNELSPQIIDLIAQNSGGDARLKFCQHLHLPLQSGDDTVLERMHRPYTSRFFRETVLAIREKIPHAAIGADVMIGFPGESEAAFENSFTLIAELPLTYLHVFPFSPRQGTPASRFRDQIPAPIVKLRSQKMRRLGLDKKKAFYKSFVGKSLKVLVEGRRDPASGLLKGMSSNYIPVLFSGEDAQMNRFAEVKITKVDLNCRVYGERVVL